MAKLERTYNVPMRKDFQKAPLHKRANRAVKALRDFIKKHMKSENVIIGKHLNEKIWERGIKRPPHHVKVNAVKDDDGKVTVELFGIKVEEEKKEDTKKKEEKKPEEEKEEKAEKKKETEEKKEEVKEEKKEVKEEKKEEVKEEKKEEPKKLPEKKETKSKKPSSKKK